MNQLVFSVKDRQMDAFMQPFFVPSRGVAIRSFSDEVIRADSPMRAHPEDYSLHHIGWFNQETGGLEAIRPEMVALASDYIPDKPY